MKKKTSKVNIRKCFPTCSQQLWEKNQVFSYGYHRHKLILIIKSWKFSLSVSYSFNFQNSWTFSVHARNNLTIKIRNFSPTCNESPRTFPESQEGDIRLDLTLHGALRHCQAVEHPVRRHFKAQCREIGWWKVLNRHSILWHCGFQTMAIKLCLRKLRQNAPLCMQTEKSPLSGIKINIKRPLSCLNTIVVDIKT